MQRTCSLKSRYLVSICLLLLFFSLSARVLGADSNDQEERLETTLVVVGSQLGIQDPRVETFELQQDRANVRILDVLRTMPGIAVERSGGSGSLAVVRIRGAESRHTKVLIDGIPVQELGSVFNFGTLSSLGVSTIDSLSGPLSAIWGTDSIGGTISLSTSATTPTKSLTFAGGSNSQRNLSGNWQSTHANGDLALSASDYRTDGINVSNAPNGDQDGADQRLINLNIAHSFSGVNVRGTYRRNDTRTEFDGFLRDADQFSNARREIFSIAASADATPDTEHTLRAYQTRSNLTNFVESRESNRYELRHQEVKWLGNHQWSEQLALAGNVSRRESDFEQRGAKSPWGNPNQSQTMSQTAIGLEAKLNRGSSSTRLLFRHDWNSEFDSSTAWQLGFSSAFVGGRAFSFLSTGYRQPSFIDRFGYTPDTFHGNPNLKPERSTQLEIGWRREWSSSKLRISGYAANLTDEINGFAWDPAIESATAINQSGESERQGFELSYSKAFLFGEFRSSASYVASKDPSGVDEIRRPRFSGSASVSLTYFPSWEFALAMTHTGSKTDFNFGTYPVTVEKLGAYQLMHVRITKELQKTEFNLRINNLTNERYFDVYGFQTPRREFLISATLDL